MPHFLLNCIRYSDYYLMKLIYLSVHGGYLYLCVHLDILHEHSNRSIGYLEVTKIILTNVVIILVGPDLFFLKQTLQSIFIPCRLL
jgi:hypothetical protein